MIFTVCSSQLGQVLLRDQMLPPALFLNLDVAYVSAEEIPKRGFDLHRLSRYGRRQIQPSRQADSVHGHV